jgi:hypothetical protein
MMRRERGTEARTVRSMFLAIHPSFYATEKRERADRPNENGPSSRARLEPSWIASGVVYRGRDQKRGIDSWAADWFPQKKKPVTSESKAASKVHSAGICA